MKRHRDGEPDRLGGFLRDEGQRRHRQRECRKVLELIVAVVGPEERRCFDGAGAGRPIDREIDHLVADAHRVSYRRDEREHGDPDD